MITNCRQLFQRKRFYIISLTKRCLFNEDFLGVTAYKEKRKEVLASDKADTYLQKARQVCDNPAEKPSFNLLKFIVYLVNAEDVGLVETILQRVVAQSKQSTVQFGRYSVGPEIMRMYYFLNLPLEGLSVLQNPVMLKIFHDVKSHLIIQDLLYNHKLYNEVCEVFRTVQEREIHGRHIPFLNYIMFQAACYKMKTTSSYNETIEIFKDFIKFYKKPAWPIIMYTMVYALENGSPNLALEHTLGNDSISHNIKLAALIKTGNLTKALKYFQSLKNKTIIIQSVASELYSSLESKKNELYGKISTAIEKDIAIDSFKNQTFDELAAETIHSLKVLSFKTT